MLTKSAYMEFLRCPREFWLSQHSDQRPELTLEGQHRREQGYDVQRLAREMSIFKTGIVNFERRFLSDEFDAKSDVVVTDPENGEISIYEVKSGTSVEKKPEYIDDVAFQVMVAESLGFKVAKAYVITVDTSYVRNGVIDPDRLLKVHDVTDAVVAKQPETIANARAAIKYLETEPVPNIAELCDAKFDCRFIRQHFPDIPEYNITKISRLHATKRDQLLASGIIDIRDVPADFKLSDKQRRQVDIALSGETFIDVAAIRDALGALRYPLHFLDYETFGDAIPKYEGIRPYRQMLFQYSVHTFPEPGAGPQHKYHVSRGHDGAHPVSEMLGRLREDLGGGIGSVVVWHESFEKARNIEGGDLFPEFAEFLDEVNASVFDLKTIFSNGHYIHPGFRGSASIKHVLPVLCPELSYEALEIGDGMTASIKWYHMATRRGDEAELRKIYDDLCAYCHLDTLAMVKIFEVLREVTREG
jgi:CRISPR/Cas system-associated exonuclease Cas4 (RecB family)